MELHESIRHSSLKYTSPLQRVQLLKRYKRFLADVRDNQGHEFTVHTPNTGSMLGCAEPGSYIWIRDSGNAKRKYRHSWELSETGDGVLVGVNTGLANHLVREAIGCGAIESLTGFEAIRSEVPYGVENSRIDLLLEQNGGTRCYVEVKNVTARAGDAAIFPDAVSSRGAKHLRELAAMVAEGHRGVIFFCVQRGDVAAFRPAAEIDPVYAETLARVAEQGVEVLAYSARVEISGVELAAALPVSFGQ